MSNKHDAALTKATLFARLLGQSAAFGKPIRASNKADLRAKPVRHRIFKCLASCHANLSPIFGIITLAFACPRPFSFTYRMLRARRLMTVSYLLGFVSYFVVLPSASIATRAVAAWDIGSFLYLAASFIGITRTLDMDIRADAKAHQEGEWTIFTLIILSAIMSLASVFLFSKLTGTAHHKAEFLGFVSVTLLLSWTLTQASFAYRYAHEYYSYDLGGPDIDGGIIFPGDERPDYLDFIYFSFVLGMTFQVSDCNITSKTLRRLATVQGLVGFLFNTVILALAINIIASSL